MGTTSTTRPVIAALGVCHRDVELAVLWVKWVTFLASKGRPPLSHLLIVYTRRAAFALPYFKALFHGASFPHSFFPTADEDESGYPKSASHLFLRTLETAEEFFPGCAVLWCEADTVPMRPPWFSEIAAEYQTCGKPFLGARVGKKNPQMSGIGVYPPDWRKLAPKIAGVLDAPDLSQYGKNRGMPWDVFARDQIFPNMAESKTIFTIWKERQIRPTFLKDIPESCALFHQDKLGSTIREIAALRYPEFMSTITSGRRFFFMNGHPSRLGAKGLKIKFSYSKFSAGFHRSAVCSDELAENDASALATLVGQLGIREITEEEFLKLTSRQAKSLPPARVVRTIERPPSNHSHPQVFVMLGRYGDICNVLPLLKAEADAGRRPTLVVSKDFQDILDGVSYCDRIVWEGAYDQLPEALRWLRASKKIMAPVVAQVHRNPLDRARLCDSYQKEAWRLAGHLGDFEPRGPLVFDQRDSEREEEFLKTWGKCTKPLILVGLDSVSSPFANARATISEIIHAFQPTHEIVDLADVRAHRIYDLLALFNCAALLIASDTVFIHLARASGVRLLALLNTNWRGSVAEHAAATIRYENATPEAVVVEANRILQYDPPATFTPEKLEPGEEVRVREVSLNEVHMTVSPRVMRQMFGKPRVFHCVDVYGSDARHHVAQATWSAAYEEGMVPIHLREYARDAKTELGHKKALPFLKDILQAGLNESTNDDDVICWTNSDIGFAKGFAEAVGTHVRQYGAASMRRVESNTEHHMGRDMFAFTAAWLKEWWSEMPDYVIGVPVFDLGLVAMIRLKAGIKLPLTTKNVGADMPPADMPPGFILHQSHTSEWLELNHHVKPGTRHNREAFWNWAMKYAPDTKFSKGKNLL